MKSKDENNYKKKLIENKSFGDQISFFFCDLWVKKAKNNQRSNFFISKIQKIDIWMEIILF